MKCRECKGEGLQDSPIFGRFPCWKCAGDGNEPAELGDYAGTIGRRGIFSVTVTAVRVFSPGQPWKKVETVVNFVTPEKKRLVWRTTSPHVNLAEGQSVTIKATPTRYESFKGVKKTIVTRVAVKRC